MRENSASPLKTLQKDLRLKIQQMKRSARLPALNSALNWDYIDDTEVCEKFHQYLCDKFFDGIDSLTEGLDNPIRFEPIKYMSIE